MAKTLIFAAFLIVVPKAPAVEVALHFNWPDQTQLHVTRTFERVDRREDGSVIESLSKCEYKWTAVRDGENHRIGFSDFRFIIPELKPLSQDPIVQLEYVSRQIESILPTIVVDANAQPLRLEDLDRVKQEIVSALDSIPNLKADPFAGRFVEMLTSDKVIEFRALQDWNTMIQIWSGNQVETGTVREVEEPIPVATGGAITKKLRYVIGDLMKCGTETQELGCIEVTLNETPSDSEARTAAQAILGVDIVAAVGAPESAALEVNASYSTVAKVDSLIPVRFVKEKSWSVSWQDRYEGQKKVSRQDKWSYDFKVNHPN